MQITHGRLIGDPISVNLTDWELRAYKCTGTRDVKILATSTVTLYHDAKNVDVPPVAVEIYTPSIFHDTLMEE